MYVDNEIKIQQKYLHKNHSKINLSCLFDDFDHQH